MADLEVHDNPEETRFEAYVDGKLAGFSVYDLAHGTINFIHTEVDDDYEGQGVGSDLVRQMLDQLRERGDLRVTSSCPFVCDWMRKHPDYLDLTPR